MLIRIDAHDLPGRHSSTRRDIHVGVQGRARDEILDPVPADVTTARWEFEATTQTGPDGLDVRGRYIQGGRGARFVYLSWGTVEDELFTSFGRSKLMLSAVDPATLAAAAESGTLIGDVGLVDGRGKLRMATIKPPAITWRAG